MTSATTTPFGARAFTVAAGRDAGLTRGVLSGPRFDHPFYGVRAVPGDSGGTVCEQTIELLRRYAPRLRPGAFFSHDCALVAVGSPEPTGWRPTVHVSVYRPAMSPRTVGVVGHRLQERDRAPWRIGELPIEYPARAWVQAATLWRRDDLIAAGDHLVRRRNTLVTIEDLRAEAIAMRRPRLLAVIDEVRSGSESKRETLLRLTVMRAGLPEPELNLELRRSNGTLVARLDLAWPRYRVAAEYDGRQHASNVEQFRRDADRWDAIRGYGWELERVLDHHLRDGAATAVAKVRAALERRGWRPST